MLGRGRPARELARARLSRDGEGRRGGAMFALAPGVLTTALATAGVFGDAALPRARQGAELRGEAHVSRRAPTWVRESTGGARHETCAGWAALGPLPSARSLTCVISYPISTRQPPRGASLRARSRVTLRAECAAANALACRRRGPARRVLPPGGGAPLGATSWTCSLRRFGSSSKWTGAVMSAGAALTRGGTRRSRGLGITCCGLRRRSCFGFAR